MLAAVAKSAACVLLLLLLLLQLSVLEQCSKAPTRLLCYIRSRWLARLVCSVQITVRNAPEEAALLVVMRGLAVFRAARCGS
jgi:hypothetical protein